MDGTRDALWLVGQSRGHGSRSRSAHGLAQALTCQLGEIRGACYSRLDHGSFGQLRTRGKVSSVLRWANKSHFAAAVIVHARSRCNLQLQAAQDVPKSCGLRAAGGLRRASYLEIQSNIDVQARPLAQVLTLGGTL